MSDESATAISIIGLPASGKTTFLAALWHLVQSGEIETRLAFGSLASDDFTYLNAIAKRWRSATVQERTEGIGIKSVIMNLLDKSGREVRVTLPDVPGEEFRRMWEEREVDEGLATTLSTGNVMLLLNGNKIKSPAWVTERAALGAEMGVPLPEMEPASWVARLAPTQVQLVDLLQHLRAPPLDAGPRRLIVAICAWDKAEGEGLIPADFLSEKLPLLDQYLRAGRDGWEWRVYGVSAQGGEYDEVQPDAVPKDDAVRLRDLAQPSERIRLVFGKAESHDLTEPLEWLVN